MKPQKPLFGKESGEFMWSKPQQPSSDPGTAAELSAEGTGRAPLSREQRLVEAQKQLSSMAAAAAAVQGGQGFTPTSGAGNADYTASKFGSAPQGPVLPETDPFHVDKLPDYVTNGALCYKQKPTLTIQWPERYVKIEGYSLNFYDAERSLLGSGSDDSLATVGKKRGSSIDDVSGCTVSMGTEKGYFGGWTRRNLPTVILKRDGAVIVEMAFEEGGHATKFHEILTDLVRKKHATTRKAGRDESDRLLNEIHELGLQRVKLPDRAAAALAGREAPLSRVEMNQLVSDMMDGNMGFANLPPAPPIAGPPSGLGPNMPPAEAQPAETQAVLREKLIAKGFNLEGLVFFQVDASNVIISKNALNKDKILIPMNILLRINNWGGKREYENLELDDFYIFGITNGTQEQAAAGIDVNKGVFTGFLKEFLSDVQTFYVKGATPYLDLDLFDCVHHAEGITKCNIKASDSD